MKPTKKEKRWNLCFLQSPSHGDVTAIMQSVSEGSGGVCPWNIESRSVRAWAPSHFSRQSNRFPPEMQIRFRVSAKKLILFYFSYFNRDSQTSANRLSANFGEAGSRLKVCCQGKYQSFVTKAESKPSHKIDGSRLSYSTSSQISSY